MTNRTWIRFGLPVTLVAVVAVAYGGMAGAFFVRDDYMWLYDARAQLDDPIQFWTHRPSGYFRPATNLFFGLEYAAFGTNPRGYFAVNALLHLWNAAWLVAVVALIARDTTAGWVAGVAFAALSRFAPAVDWISSIVTLLTTAAFLPALWFWVRHLREGGATSLVLSWLLAMAALLSKESGIVVVPLFVVAYAVEKGPRSLFSRAALARLAPLLLIVVGYFVVQAEALRAGRMDLLADPLHVTVMQAAVASLAELPVILLPVGAEAPAVRSPWLGGALLVGIALLLGALRARPVRLLVWIAFAAALLAPFVWFLTRGEGLAGRYSYLPGLTVAALVGLVSSAVLRRFEGRWLWRSAVGLAGLVALVLHVQAIRNHVSGSARFRVQGDHSRTLIEGLRAELLELDGRGARWVLVDLPVENDRHLACLGAVFLDLEIDAFTAHRIEAADGERPPGLDRDPRGWLRASLGAQRVLLYTRKHGLVDPGTLGREANSRILLGLQSRWRPTKAEGRETVHVLDLGRAR